ncbi:hypothetical protein D9619_003513 [Psilocybe cf. subviscida]|uniref:NUC153 domain-containing protein n=1 Tax=Psilocybe cf. subviscida TaxID=2480587 RepID=A0A8H5AXR3_9AGAR|nr:hypothetical protein D9619_003513 [Psilocybe cf. subviscida]
MSDPRFARLKTDPRFRRPKTKSNKVVIDERFKSVFDTNKEKSGKASRKVDKYGRPVSKTQDQDNLRRYYRLENEDDDDDKSNEEEAPRKPDLARGEVLLESSSEEEDDDIDSADDGGFVTLGADSSRPISVPDEIDLDEDSDAYAYAEAQAAQYAREHQDDDEDEEAEGKGGERTRRLAIVNLDWEHVRAHHLFKICASLVSPTAPIVPASATSSRVLPDDGGRNKKRSSQGVGASGVNVARGKVLSVRVYPSDFGRARMAKEEVEGPPSYIFKKKSVDSAEDVNERTVYEVGGEEDEVDEDALRKYQLERLRYYYAIVECDTVDAASHIFNELEGTELERSANLFDLSFVPEDMTFENDPRDEATDELNTTYKPVEYVTDALRHSKVKLTWDDDDPERNQVTRRALTRKEIDENDFRAYIANTSSESEADGDDDNDSQVQAKKAAAADPKQKKKDKKAAREKLRALLLGGNEDAMPEGWGADGGGASGWGEGAADDVDMEITFTPGLTGKKDDQDETTLEKYQRKMREKRKKRKEEVKIGKEEKEGEGDEAMEAERDEFFEADSEEEPAPKKVTGKKDKKDKKGKKSSRHADADDEPAPSRKEATAEELALLVASDNPNAEPKHFNLKAVIKSEKAKKRKGRKGSKKGGAEDEGEAQEDFVMNVKDDRFKVLFEDHQFAIDPTNPHFKKTKAMTALLDERQKRQRELRSEDRPDAPVSTKRRAADEPEPGTGAKSLQSLVESVKRKSANVEAPGQGKRRKL